MVYIGNANHIKKYKKIQNLILVPGVQKTDFFDFLDFVIKNMEIRNPWPETLYVARKNLMCERKGRTYKSEMKEGRRREER